MKYEIDMADALELKREEIDSMADAIRMAVYIGDIAEQIEDLPWSTQQAAVCAGLAQQLKANLKLLWMTEARERAGNL